MVNGTRHGNGKRWLLIALIVLGAFWLVNDAYRDGYYDALVQTGQITRVRDFDGGPDFPWGLLIVGGIAYIAWRKGVFDRFSGPGSGPSAPNMGFGSTFRGPRAIFDEWHREAHAAERGGPSAPAVPLVPQAPATQPAARAPQSSAGGGNGMSPAPGTPAPTPPAPDYWSTMTRAAEAPAAADGDASPRTADEPGQSLPGNRPDRGEGTAGPALERW